MNSGSRVNAVANFLFRLARMALVLAIAGAGAFWLYENRTIPEKKSKETLVPKVQVMTMAPGSKVMIVEAFGTVTPRRKVHLSSEVPGRIHTLHPGFVAGGGFQKDDLLAGIDPESFRLDRQAATVRVRQTKADILGLEQETRNLKQEKELYQAGLILAQKELERIKRLSVHDFASKNSLDRADQQVVSARIQVQNITSRLALTGPLMAQKQATLAMAQVDLEKADLALQKTQIRADFDGFVLVRSAQVGEYVNPGQLLGILYEKGALDVDVRIPLEQMKWIRHEFGREKLPKAQVEMANVASVDDLIWEAAVARVHAAVDEKTRTLPMTLEIGRPRGNDITRGIDLKPGAFVRCRIFGRQVDQVFAVPRHLLMPGDRLFLLTGGHLEIRPVRVLRKIEEEVYIDSGLAPGDQVITSPVPGAVDGMALVIGKDRG